MSRNKEKHVVKLNRLWLQSLDEENSKKNPPRPGLGSLKTASEVKKWIPSIKRDIDFCLKQSQVTCYPDSHIKDFSTRIEALTGEYKAYIRKLRELEPQTDAVPWTDRPYKRKHKSHEINEDGKDEPEDEESNNKVKKTDFSAIVAPVLEAEVSVSEIYGYSDTSSEIVQNVDPETADLPLVFNSKQLSIEAPPSYISETSEIHEAHQQTCNEFIEHKDNAGDIEIESRSKCVGSSNNRENRTSLFKELEECETYVGHGSKELNRDNNDCQKGRGTVMVSGDRNVKLSDGSSGKPAVERLKLFIPYSDSSSEEEDDD